MQTAILQISQSEFKLLTEKINNSFQEFDSKIHFMHQNIVQLQYSVTKLQTM